MTPAPPENVPGAYRLAILAAYPALAESRITIAGSGWHSLALDADGLIFKFPAGDEAEAALRREARVLRVLQPLVTMPVPRMTLHEGEFLFSAHEKLPGSTLEAAQYGRLSEAARDGLARDLALFFSELHAIPAAIMRDAGAEPIGVWDTADATLAPVWPTLPGSVRETARAAIAAYRALPSDPLGEVYGFFDAHGWNMAFDHDAGRLGGIFDFADSGFGPLHREFVQVSLISPDLAARTIRAYKVRTGRTIDPARVFLLASAMRLSELAGAMEADADNVGFIRGLVTGWMQQRDVR